MQGALEGIGPQVNHQGCAPLREWIHPYIETMGIIPYREGGLGSGEAQQTAHRSPMVLSRQPGSCVAEPAAREILCWKSAKKVRWIPAAVSIAARTESNRCRLAFRGATHFHRLVAEWFCGDHQNQGFTLA
jgi:hypothetical protein